MSYQKRQARKPGRPPVEESESALSNLYRVAFYHYIASGLEGANLQLIAKEAGVSRQMIHNRFGSKELFFQKVNRFAESYLNNKFDFKQLEDCHDPWASFIELADQMLDIFLAKDTVQVFRVMNLAIYRNPEIGKWHTKSLNKAYLRLQRLLQKSADERGLLLKIDKSASRDFISLIYGYALPVIQGRSAHPSKKQQKTQVELMVARYLRGLGFGDPPA